MKPLVRLTRDSELVGADTVLPVLPCLLCAVCCLLCCVLCCVLVRLKGDSELVGADTVLPVLPCLLCAVCCLLCCVYCALCCAVCLFASHGTASLWGRTLCSRYCHACSLAHAHNTVLLYTVLLTVLPVLQCLLTSAYTHGAAPSAAYAVITMFSRLAFYPT